MDTIRLVIYKNTKSPGPGTSILVRKYISLPELLTKCSSALNSEYKLIFTDKGLEVVSPLGLQDGSSLYLSKGERFQATAEENSSGDLVFLMLGAAGVGKSAITLRYVRNLFVSYYDPTIEDYYKHTSVLEGETYHHSILDTAGMEDYEPLLDEWIEKKQAILLVFSVEMPDSMEKLEGYHQKINQRYSKGNRPEVVLVGNKTDMDRCVTFAEAKAIAERLKVKYYEVSAATGAGIKELFSDLLISIRNKTRKPAKIPWYRKCTIL